MIDTPFIEKAKAFATEKMANMPAEYTFHTIEHTKEVVFAVNEIGTACDLSPDQLETVTVAAWFHDIGYCEGYNQHEKVSAETARTLMTEWGAPEQKIEAVQQAILATALPQNPVDIIGEVLCDADMYHLAKGDVEEVGEKIRQELQSFRNIKFDSEEEWMRFNLTFLKEHEYFTAYGKLMLQPLKKLNLKKLKKQLEKMEGGKEGDSDKEKELEKLRKKQEKANKPERGIETMFRTTSQNHVTLSGMADTKANIMISVNTIVLSIIVSVLFRKLDQYPKLVVPTLLLVATCLVTIVFAILATRPNVTSGRFTREDILNKKTNLLYFGNFYKIGLKDYEWGMLEMMKDSDYLYRSLIKDIYFLGKVLAQKYKYLRLSYTIFMFGFVLSIISFMVVMVVYYQPADLHSVLGF